VYRNLLIRNCTFGEINTFGLPKLRKISFAFNIFAPSSVQEMVYFKRLSKNITPMDVFMSGTIDKNRI